MATKVSTVNCKLIAAILRVEFGGCDRTGMADSDGAAFVMSVVVRSVGSAAVRIDLAVIGTRGDYHWKVKGWAGSGR